MFSIIIVYFLNSFFVISGKSSDEQIKQTAPLSAPLTTFLMYEDKLYIGGANQIYILDKDLNQIQTANTCEPRSGDCSENINKILLAHHSKIFHLLITCGTGNSGLCEARNLSDIGSVLWKSSPNTADDNYLKVSTNRNRPAVGLITGKGDFIVALTFGDGIDFSESKLQSWKTSETYNYAISARELGKFVPVSQHYTKKVIKLQISKNVGIHNYLIYYKVCFQHNGILYFATNQKHEVGSEHYVSKLVRICQNDTGFQSYTDIVINCNRSNVTYNLIQDAIIVDSEYYAGEVFIGVFTKGTDPEQKSGESVICVTEMEKIDDAITNLILDYISSCDIYGPEELRYLPTFKKNGTCVPKDVLDRAEMACHKTATYSNVIGKDSINIHASSYTPNVTGHITTLTGANFKNKSVVMFGTSTGIIIQTVLLQNHEFVENFKITVDSGNEIKKIYADGEDNVYAVSNEKVLKYAIPNCSEFQSCADVVKHKHPFCGWCVFKGRSTRRSECSEIPGHWISSFDKCLDISVTPTAILLSRASASPKIVTVDIQDIPEKNLTGAYYCKFSLFSKEYKTKATEHDNRNITCLFPNFTIAGEVRIEVMIVTQAGAEISLASATILIYECGKYNRCMECINIIKGLCMWCSEDASCQDMNAVCPGPISDDKSCPHLLSNKDIFISTGTSKLVSFKIANASNFTGVIYRCILPSSESVIANLNGDFLSCNVQVEHIGPMKKRDYRIKIKYGPDIKRLVEIDDTFANSVTVYRCGDMASDCSHCQALNKTRYNCSWSDTNECIASRESLVSQCPPPDITKVIPMDGSIYGGTLVTIYGRNLGSSLSDSYNISVANVTCDLIKKLPDKDDPDYDKPVPSRLVCETGSSAKATKGAVIVVVENQVSNTSLEFSYKSPNISHIYPNFGPVAGGTKITVYGKQIGIGNRKWRLSLGEYRCDLTGEVTEVSDNEDASFECVIKCKGLCESISNVTELSFSIDEKIIEYNKNVWFNFIENPVVGQIAPLKALVSGGTLFTVTGKSLDNAHSSSVTLHYKEENAVAKCEIMSPVKAVCEAPEAPDALKDQLASQLASAGNGKQKCDIKIDVPMGLNFDAVTYNFTISYKNDPVFDILPKDRYVLTFDPGEPWIFLTGQCYRDFNIEIKVGDKPCTIINITQTTIKCFAPVEKPRVLPGNIHPEISVSVGNVYVTVGYLRYITEGKEATSTLLILSLSATAVMICSIVSGTFCVCRRIRKLKNRVTYLEVKKGVVRRRRRNNSRRKTNKRTNSRSGVYDDINDEELEDNPEDIIGETLVETDDGYLQPHPYVDVDQINPLESLNQSNRSMGAKEYTDDEAVNVYIHPVNDAFERSMGAKENTDDDAVNVYIHPVNDVFEREARHLKPARLCMSVNDISERADIVINTKERKQEVYYSCISLNTYVGEKSTRLISIQAENNEVPRVRSQQEEENIYENTRDSLRTGEITLGQKPANTVNEYSKYCDICGFKFFY